jgi:hypothetical protein
MKTILIILIILSISISAMAQDRIGSSFYTQTYYGFSGLTFIPNAHVFSGDRFGISYNSGPAKGSELTLLPYSLRLIYGFSGNTVEIATTNTPFYASERIYNGVSINHGVPDFDNLIPIFPSVKYQVMPMSRSNYQVLFIPV